MARLATDEGLKEEVFDLLLEYIRAFVRNDDTTAGSLSVPEIDLSYHTPFEKLAHQPGFVHPLWVWLEDFGNGEIFPAWIYFSEFECARWCSLNIIVNDGGRLITTGNCAFVMKRIDDTWRFVQIRFFSAE